MESVEASLVFLDAVKVEERFYALVPRPLPSFIPSECAVTGEITLFKEAAKDAKIEATYMYDGLYKGWELSD